MSLLVFQSVQEIKNHLPGLKSLGKTIGFVPTMGALHEGHASLLRAARRENDIVVLSIFVNPTQFGANEDLTKYPRTLEKDLEIARSAGVDIAFVPTPEEVFPKGWRSYIEIEELSSVLCGKFRPGHFRGVATVVYRLFQITIPTRAYFGRKDLQQVLVLKRMVQDLGLPVTVLSCKTLTDPDGLAMSSRNLFLSSEERKTSLVIPRALDSVVEKFHLGVVDHLDLIAKAKVEMAKESELKMQYLEIRSLPNLEKVGSKLVGPAAVFFAGFVGNTRLIDNRILISDSLGGDSAIDSFIF